VSICAWDSSVGIAGCCWGACCWACTSVRPAPVSITTPAIPASSCDVRLETGMHPLLASRSYSFTRARLPDQFEAEFGGRPEVTREQLHACDRERSRWCRLRDRSFASTSVNVRDDTTFHRLWRKSYNTSFYESPWSSDQFNICSSGLPDSVAESSWHALALPQTRPPESGGADRAQEGPARREGRSGPW